jgi:hypothetical protein
MKKSFENLLDESIENIRSDRQKTSDLLNDLVVYISNNSDKHKEVGLTLAKYLETLQRSNEQLVKLTSLIKKSSEESDNLSDLDRDKIFEHLTGQFKAEKKDAKK